MRVSARAPRQRFPPQPSAPKPCSQRTSERLAQRLHEVVEIHLFDGLQHVLRVDGQPLVFVAHLVGCRRQEVDEDSRALCERAQRLLLHRHLALLVAIACSQLCELGLDDALDVRLRQRVGISHVRRGSRERRRRGDARRGRCALLSLHRMNSTGLEGGRATRAVPAGTGT